MFLKGRVYFFFLIFLFNIFWVFIFGKRKNDFWFCLYEFLNRVGKRLLMNSNSSVVCFGIKDGVGVGGKGK